MKRKRLVKILMADGADKRCAETIATLVVRHYGRYKIGGFCWIDFRKSGTYGLGFRKGHLEGWL